MRSPTQHVTRCVIAGIVALLPVGGVVLTVTWIESKLSGGWLGSQPFYFPGLGLLAAFAIVYLTGLFVTTFLGRWLLRSIDRAAERMPLVGSIYQSAKEVLGYDTTRERFFQGVVLVDCGSGDQLGLVTGTAVIDGGERTIVYVPGTPNPASGQLVFVPTAQLRRIDVRASSGLRTLVAMGKTPLSN